MLDDAVQPSGESSPMRTHVFSTRGAIHSWPLHFSSVLCKDLHQPFFQCFSCQQTLMAFIHLTRSFIFIPEGDFTGILEWQLFSLSTGNGFCFLVASMISYENSAVIERVFLLLVMHSFSLMPPFFFWVSFSAI